MGRISINRGLRYNFFDNALGLVDGSGGTSLTPSRCLASQHCFTCGQTTQYRMRGLSSDEVRTKQTHV